MNHYKELLNVGADFGFHFIIGSSMPYRNLLLQHMANDNKTNNRTVLNQSGAEVIYNPDGMIFFRYKNTMEFIPVYPVS